MSDVGGTSGKQRDAARTSEAILAAAEAVFAEHGFAGARTDTIASMAGYNKSLIGQYFGGKLGLYTAVLKRADRDMSELHTRLFAPLRADEGIASDAQRLRDFLKTMVEAYFDYMVEHPNFTRIINWEQASGWQTFKSIASQFETDDLTQLEALFAEAKRAGLLRPDLDTAVVLLLVQQMCWSSLATLPLYQSFPGKSDATSHLALNHLREQIVALLMAGLTDHGNEEIR